MPTQNRHPESRLEEEVAQSLMQLGFVVDQGIGVQGYEPDMVATSPSGHKVVVEVKGWRVDLLHIERAKAQVELYRRALGADAGAIVLAGLEHGAPSDGLYAVHELPQLIAVLAKLAPRPPLQRFEFSAAQSKRKVFAAMPFAPEFDDVYFVAMTHAASEIGAVCTRVDKEDFDGDVVEEIKRLIRESVALVVDLSHARPNVLYELGYAQGLGKPCVLLSCTPMSDLPFDVRNWSVLAYAPGRTTQLREPLAKRLRAVVGGA